MTSRKSSVNLRDITVENFAEDFSQHMFQGKVNLKDLLIDQLRRFFDILGQSKFRANQVFRWLYVNRATSFDQMTDLSHHLREKLKEVAIIPQLTLETPKQSLQDTTKFLFTLPDGNQVESVRMHYIEHLGPGRVAVCLSTQVGCAMKCAFCASGKLGLVRNLEVWEIVDQVLQIQRMLDPEDVRVANVVFMGIGEPLHNFENLMRSIELINSGDGLGIGMRHIAISTCGIVPTILELAEKKLPLKLAISLHATSDKVRSEIMPVNRRWGISELINACRIYQENSGRRITFEYVMLKDVNDSLEDAERLVHMLKGIRSLINLIPWNEVEHPTFCRSSNNAVRAFQEKVEALGVRCTVRREKGSDIDAACGQLRLRALENKE